MDVLYLSSMCSVKEYERMFEKYGSTSSHASQKFNRLLVRGLIENGFHVDALTQRILPKPDADDLVHESEWENDVNYYYISQAKNRKVNRFLVMMRAFSHIMRWAKAHKDGIVICDIVLGELSMALMAARKLKKIRTAAIVTDVPSVRAGEKRTGLRALPVKIKNSVIKSYDSYIFLTEQMNKLLNVKKRPYVIIEGFADEGVLEKPNTIENKHPQKVIMMAGLLEEIFGVEALLNAFQKIDCPDAVLRFYGKGSSVSAIEAAAINDSRISYCGELKNSQIVEEEKRATLLINPRPAVGEWTAFSFPSKNIEYMASGTPLVAYDLPCIPREYLPYFYQITDGNQMSQLLQELLYKDPAELHSSGLKAQKWVTEHKSVKVQAAKVVRMLQKER